MIDALLDLPPHLQERLASALDSGLLVPPYTEASLRSVIGAQRAFTNIIDELLELEHLGISGLTAAAWLRTVKEAASRIPRPNLVWSGPEVPGVPARDTRRVYEQLSLQFVYT